MLSSNIHQIKQIEKKIYLEFNLSFTLSVQFVLCFIQIFLIDCSLRYDFDQFYLKY